MRIRFIALLFLSACAFSSCAFASPRDQYVEKGCIRWFLGADVYSGTHGNYCVDDLNNVFMADLSAMKSGKLIGRIGKGYSDFTERLIRYFDFKNGDLIEIRCRGLSGCLERVGTYKYKEVQLDQYAHILAFDCYEKENWDCAESWYTRYLIDNPNDHLMLVSRGITRNNQGKYLQAISDFSSAIRINPRDYDQYFQRSISKVRIKDYYGAIRDLSESIGRNPSHLTSYYNRGSAYMRVGDYGSAIDDYTIVILRDPDDSDAYLNRGRCKGYLGDIRGASLDFRVAKRLDQSVSLSEILEFKRLFPAP